MYKLINLTQHAGSTEQVSQGLIEPQDKGAVQRLLTFTGEDILAQKIEARAESLAELALKEGATAALVGGLPALMGPLCAALEDRGIAPVFAHSDRVSEDQTQPDGSVKKVAIFRHQFFYYSSGMRYSA